MFSFPSFFRGPKGTPKIIKILVCCISQTQQRKVFESIPANSTVGSESMEMSRRNGDCFGIISEEFWGSGPIQAGSGPHIIESQVKSTLAQCRPHFEICVILLQYLFDVSVSGGFSRSINADSDTTYCNNSSAMALKPSPFLADGLSKASKLICVRTSAQPSFWN